MKAIQCFSIATLLVLNACGGGSSDTSTPPSEEQDRYDISSYSSPVSNQTDLSGTWLYTAQFDLESQDQSVEPPVTTRIQVEMRSLVNIVQTEDDIDVHAPSSWCELDSIHPGDESLAPSGRCFTDLDGYAYLENGELTIDIGIGELVGNLDDNIISGQTYAYPGENTIIHSSSAGMVKLSHVNSLYDLAEEPSEWGDIDGFPIRLFSESRITRQLQRGGTYEDLDQIYSLKAFASSMVDLTPDNSSDNPYLLESQYELTHSQLSANPAAYPEEWYLHIWDILSVAQLDDSGIPESPVFGGNGSTLTNTETPVTRQVTGEGAVSGESIQRQAPLVSRSNTTEIIGSATWMEPNVIEVGGSFIVDGETERNVDIVIQL